ncbi:MAG: DUF3592 domain-containing protein [Anaerolineales bacterium]|nr:DUF3592 domain-containing protein [Anaerolineales bacterium]
MASSIRDTHPPDFRRRRWLLIGSVFACLALWTVSGFLFDVLGEWVAWGALLVGGETTQGEVTRQATYEAEGIFYQLEYEFLISNGGHEEHLYHGSQLVSQSFWKRHEPGSSLTIRYLPSRPTTTRIEGQPYELNLNTLTLCMFQVCIAQLVLLPLLMLGVVRHPERIRLFTSLVGGGMCAFLVTLVGLVAEFVLDAMGLMLGWWSGGAIELILGITVAMVVGWTIWRYTPGDMLDRSGSGRTLLSGVGMPFEPAPQSPDRGE